MPAFKKPDIDAQPVNDLLTSKPLERLIRASKKRLQLQTILQEALPAEIFADLTSCVIEGYELVLSLDSHRWSTHLRALRNDILFAIDRAQRFGKVTTIRTTIRPRTSAPAALKSSNPPIPPPPANAAESINSLADDCEHDTLKMSLKRLAAHLAVKSK